jgi:choline dehydrogenase-like flavoprotein
VFRNGLGVVNLSFPDTRRPDNVLFLERDAGHPLGRLHAHYRPPEGEDADICAALALLRKAFRKISAPLVPRMTHIRPMGASVHYAGTLPMTTERRKLAVTSGCQSWDHPNLWVVDGSVFPSLPAKNLTFTLMANAARIAATEF